MGRPILSPGKKLTGEKTDRYTGIEILRWCETSVKTAHFAIKEKLKESAVIKKDGKKQMTTGVRDLCVKIGNLADHGWFCCTVEEHGICFV